METYLTIEGLSLYLIVAEQTVRHWGLSGKTAMLVMAIICMALRFAGLRHLIFRYRAKDARLSVLRETLIPWLDSTIGKNAYSYLAHESMITLFHGSEIWIGSLGDRETLTQTRKTNSRTYRKTAAHYGKCGVASYTIAGWAALVCENVLRNAKRQLTHSLLMTRYVNHSGRTAERKTAKRTFSNSEKLYYRFFPFLSSNCKRINSFSRSISTRSSSSVGR